MDTHIAHHWPLRGLRKCLALGVQENKAMQDGQEDKHE